MKRPVKGMAGTALLYNLNSDKGRKIRLLCLQQGIRIRNVGKESFGEKLGALAGMPDMPLTGQIYEGQGFDDEMIVLKGFSDGALDRFLSGLRSSKCTVALKAVVTELNCQWDSVKLHEELAAEHAEMSKR